MLRTGLSILLLLMISGCATFSDEPSEQAEQINVEQSRNEQLKQEAAALREAVQQQQSELERIQSGSSN